VNDAVQPQGLSLSAKEALASSFENVRFFVYSVIVWRINFCGEVAWNCKIIVNGGAEGMLKLTWDKTFFGDHPRQFGAESQSSGNDSQTLKAERASETLSSCSKLKSLVAWEDFTTFSSRGNFKSFWSRLLVVTLLSWYWHWQVWINPRQTWG
jgi:hypothetical protein